MTIEEQVNDGIKNAMKAHDKVRLETMRNIKKVILEAKTRPGANDRIDDAECIKLIQKLAKQGKESAEIYRQQGREDLYEQESGQVAVLEEFLPKQLDEAELTEALKAIIAEVGASSAKDMGKVMDTATKLRAARKYNSKLDPRSFHKGDLVWRMASKARKHQGKFSPNWEGPFRVLQEVGNGAYRLERLSGDPIPNTWNASHLKFYFS